MTIKQLKKMLKGVPDIFDIAIEAGEKGLMPICPTDSGVVQLEFDDTKKKVFVFVLAQCSCAPGSQEMEKELASLN